MPPQVPDTRRAACHDNTLPQWAVDKMARRRGRMHAFETFVPAETALVVIDATEGFVRGTPCGLSIVEPINRLAEALCTAGGTVAWVMPGPMIGRDPILLALWGEESFRLTAESTSPDNSQSALGSGLVQDKDDLVVSKRAYSAFFPGRCDLADRLRARGIDTVLIAGALTNICCESSARDAATLGFRTVMVADANAARSDAEHQSALYNVLQNFGDVRTSDELIGTLSG